MTLLRLDVSDFRNLISAKLTPVFDGFNVIYGNNGSGKTSLLEAIYYLSRGRSFRSPLASRIINKNADKFSVFAQIQTNAQQQIPIGIERQRGGDVKIRVAGQNEVAISELVRLTPALLINSNCYNLLDGGPVFRRKYLDWGAFYTGNDFLRIWKQYERALSQRNAALRKRASKKELETWTNELIQHALPLDQLRRELVQQLMPFLQGSLNDLLQLPGLTMSYQPGWNEDEEYADAITQSIESDMSMGYTQAGPHRADFKLAIKGAPLKDILSRGQQKLFVCAMIIAQGALLQKCTNKRPVYLVDDLPSELDIPNRANLLALLSRQNVQVFITAVEREDLTTLAEQGLTKLFHVEHGDVTEELNWE